MSKPVTIRFVGDESRFKATTEAVGGRLRGFGKQVDDESRRAGGGLDKLSESTDNSERNLIGLHDVIDGTAAIMAGPGEAGIAAYVQGWADLAGGITPLIETLKNVTVATISQTVATIRARVAAVASAVAQRAVAVATRAWTIAQWALNAAMTANPIGIVIAIIVALVAAVVIAYKRSETFRNIVNGVFRAVVAAARNFWAGIKEVFGRFMDLAGRVADRVRSDLRKIIDFLKQLPARALQYGRDLISNFIAGVRAMAGALKAAILAIIPGPIADFLHLRSPAKEGPLSRDGGPEGWGRRLVDQYVRGLRSRAGVQGPVSRLAGLLADATGGAGPGGGRGGGNTFHNTFHTNASATDIARELAWQLRTSGY